MKRLLLTLIAISFAVIGFAQPFTLAVDGFRSTEDITKDYIVITVPECTKDVLFQRAKNYVTATFNSPQNVMSESGTDMISVLGGENISYSAGRMGRTPASFKYKYIVELRDGRAKITPVWIDLHDEVNKYAILSKGLMLGVYRKNGELRDDKAKAQIEEIVNGLAFGLEKAMKETTVPASEDW